MATPKHITEDLRTELARKRPDTWATIIPSRSSNPVVKTHATLAHAKNAVSGRQGAFGAYLSEKGGWPLPEAEVYHLVDGEWELLWRIENGTYPNDLPWKSE